MSGMTADTPILIVEDDPLISDDLANLLGEKGYSTIQADNALAAVNLIRNGAQPALILLDMLLPGADGWQFFAECRRSPALRAFPVVVMTELEVASEPWARAMGAVDLLQKPIDVNRLFIVVQRYARRPGQEIQPNL